MTGRARILRTLALGAVTSALAGAAAAEKVAYANAVLHPIGRPAVEGGALLVEDGTITALEESTPAASDGWRIVDLGGRHVWPGLIDAATDLGLVEVGSVRGTRDTTEVGDFNTDLRVEVAFHPDSRRILPTVAGGVLTAHVVPGGALFLGQSAAMRLDGWTWEEMALRAPVGQFLSFPTAVRRTVWWDPQTEEEFAKQHKEAMRRLDEIVGAARGYHRARSAAESGEALAVDIDPRFEALRPVLAGELPLFLWAEEYAQIEKALDWAAENGFSNLVLLSGPDAAEHAERLARDGVPVILNGVYRLPDRSWDPYDAPFTAAARLHAAGVRIAFTGEGSSNARNLPFHAAAAVAYGLPRAAAHAALTADAAAILGIDDRVGNLGPGLEATFFVASGDPLDIRTAIERVFVRGAEVDLGRDAQRQLWERFRDRPAAEAGTD